MKKILKWFFLVGIALLIIGILFGNSDKDSQTEETTQKISSEERQEDMEEVIEEENVDLEINEKAQENDAYIELGQALDLDKYEITITSASLIKDYEGKDALKLTYDFTNNSEESIAPFLGFGSKAFQNGIEIDSIPISDDLDLGIGQKEIRPGITLENAEFGFILDDFSKVEIEIDELITFTDKPYILIVNPEEL